jgi:hypothetical protein
MLQFETAMLRGLPAALRVLRLLLPRDVLCRDLDGHFLPGKTVHFRSTSTGRGILSRGTVVRCFEIPSGGGIEYEVLLEDGSRDREVSEKAIAYSEAPRFALQHTLLLMDPQSYFQGSFSAEELGTTAHLLSALKYAVSFGTGRRLGVGMAETLQLVGELSLSVLVVALLHLCLGPLDRQLLYDVVSDVHETIIAGEGHAKWLGSQGWTEMSRWCRRVLPLPELEAEEEETVPLPESVINFRKGGRLRSKICYVPTHEQIE